MQTNSTISGLFKRIETDISNYLSSTVELSEGVKFSQYQTIKRIYKFRNRSLSGSKINEDLSYNYYYDMISPRADGEVKNLRFDTKHVLLFSQNPIKDFSAVFIANAKLKEWMADNGEDDKLKAAVEEFVTNGNVGFKKMADGYEIMDSLNTYITNETAEGVDDTDLIERHSMGASEMKRMTGWDQEMVDKTIEEFANKTFNATELSTSIESSSPKYEVYEYSGEVSDKEYKALSGDDTGNPHEYYLAKIIVSGLHAAGTGDKLVLFSEKLKGKLSDHYEYAHRGRYEGRFWRVGMYELLFDHQIRANEIGNQLARGLDWASRVVFKSGDSQVLQNIRADLDNGDVVFTDDLSQVDVRMAGLDQLVVDWNRLMQDADRLSNSFEIVRGESLPSGTPFRLGALMDQNAGMMFILLRQKLTLPYKRVFRNWLLPQLVSNLKGEDIFTLIGDTDILDQLRSIMVEKWYMNNLVDIGPHTREQAVAIKAVKLEELKEIDPTIENTKDMWKGVLPRIFVTITGENSDIADQVTDLINLVGLEQDQGRIAWIMDQIYRVRGIPIPPATPVEPQPTEPQAVSGAGTPSVAPSPQGGAAPAVIE